MIHVETAALLNELFFLQFCHGFPFVEDVTLISLYKPLTHFIVALIPKVKLSPAFCFTGTTHLDIVSFVFLIVYK